MHDFPPPPVPSSLARRPVRTIPSPLLERYQLTAARLAHDLGPELDRWGIRVLPVPYSVPVSNPDPA